MSLETHVDEAVSAVKKLTLDDTRKNVDLEKHHPYTQDHYMFENIQVSKKRNELLMEELEENFSATDAHEHTGKAAQNVIKSVFEANQKMSMEEHMMAIEMELCLESHGKVAFQKIYRQNANDLLEDVS